MFYLLRHGETEWNRLGKAQGIEDIPLNDTGRKQASARAAVFAGAPIEAIVSSPLVRAEETAQILADTVGNGQILTDRRLIEWDHTKADTTEGETLEGLASRVLACVHDYAKTYTGNVLFVTHSAAIYAVLCSFAPELAGQSLGLEPLSVTALLPGRDGTEDLLIGTNLPDDYTRITLTHEPHEAVKLLLADMEEKNANEANKK